MNNYKFLKIDYYNRYAFNENVTDEEIVQQQLRSGYIRSDVFLEIDDMESRHIKKGKDIYIIRVSHCYLSRIRGTGVNGIDTEIYLTEESYKKVSKELFHE